MKIEMLFNYGKYYFFINFDVIYKYLILNKMIKYIM